VVIFSLKIESAGSKGTIICPLILCGGDCACTNVSERARNRPPVADAIIKKKDRNNDKTSTLFKQICEDDVI
jgi:hypothetical protein